MCNSENIPGHNIPAREIIPRNILASENFPVAPRDFFPERKVGVCTGKSIPGKTEHFFHYFTSSEDGEEDGEEEKGACVL